MTSAAGTATVAVSEEEPEEQSTRRGWIAPFASVLSGTVLVALHAAYYRAWMVDDALITFAYARNVANGHGPVAQPGMHPVEGYSNPTWMILLVIGHWLRLWDRGSIFGVADWIVFPKALALACCVGILAAFYSAAKLLVRRPWVPTLIAGIVLASIPSFVIWAFSGLENPLYALLVTWLALLLLRAALTDNLHAPKVAILAGVLSFLAALTRPDGMIYAAAFPIVLLLFVRRETLRISLWRFGLSAAAFAVPYGLFLAWRYWEFGMLVPNTAVAKVQTTPSPTSMAKVSDLIGYVGWALILLLAVCVGVVLAERSRFARGLSVLLVPLFLALVAYGVLQQDWTYDYRYATPVWPMLAIVAALAVPRVITRARPRAAWAIAAATAGAVAISAAPLAHQAPAFANGGNGAGCLIADRYGRTFNGYADLLGLGDNASYAGPDIGGVLMTSRLRVYDIAGLIDTKFAKEIRANDMTAYQNYLYGELKPTFLHIRSTWLDTNGLLSDPRLAQDYVLIFSESGTLNGEQVGDYVRRDALTDPATQIPKLEEYARRTVWPLYQHYSADNYYTCGATLRPGQLPS